MGKVLVTGATGFAGSHLARRLLADGMDVRLLARNPAAASDLPGAEMANGDLTDPNAVTRAVDGVETVFHIAALFRKAGAPNREYWAVNCDGTRNLLEASARCGVRRFVHCSTVGVLGHIADPPADETAPYNPGDIYQITKCEGEKLALRFGLENNLPVTVVRPAGIYGPGDIRWLKMFRGIARGRFPMIGNGKTLIHLVHISDLVDLFLLAAEAPQAVNQVYIGAGERYVTLNELAGTIAEAVDAAPPELHIPLWPISLASGICEDVCRALHIEPPLYRRRVHFFLKSRAFSIAKARSQLGYQPKVSLRDGIKQTAMWYKEQNLL